MKCVSAPCDVLRRWLCPKHVSPPTEPSRCFGAWHSSHNKTCACRRRVRWVKGVGWICPHLDVDFLDFPRIYVQRILHSVVCTARACMNARALSTPCNTRMQRTQRPPLGCFVSAFGKVNKKSAICNQVRHQCVDGV